MKFVSYNRACLNCQVQDGPRHLSTFTDDEFIFDSPKATWEMRAVWKIKKTLSEAAIQCDVCQAIGCFDIWDIKINNNSIYFEPSPNQPWTKFFINKFRGELEVNAESIELGDNITVLTFFDLILQVVKNMPEFPFIEQENGFLIASVFYIPEIGEATFNSFRHSGIGKKDILFAIEEYKDTFKLQAGFSKNS